MGTCRRRERIAKLDESPFIQREQALVERLHAVVLAFGNDFFDFMRFFWGCDLVKHSSGRDQHFNRGYSTTVSAFNQSLTHDAP